MIINRLSLLFLCGLLMSVTVGCKDKSEPGGESTEVAVATPTPVGSPTPSPTPAKIDLGDGLVAEILTQGEGKEVAEGDTPRLELEIQDPSGKILWEGTFEFACGTGQATQGIDRGVRGMKVGERRELQVPWELGFGERGTDDIPGKQDLVIEATLISISESDSE